MAEAKRTNEAAAGARRTFSGLAVSRGRASAPAFLHCGVRELSIPEYPISEEQVAGELVRYDAARAKVRSQLERLIDELGGATDSGDAKIFSNHLMILDDFTIVDSVHDLIGKERINAEASLRRVVSGFRAAFARMNDTYLRERVRDLDDVERRVLDALLGKTDTPLAQIDHPVILVADDLTPSETASLPRAFIRGIATDLGSTTSHVALLARSLGIPSVAGLGDITANVHPGDMVLLDGTRGEVTVNPDSATQTEFDSACRREDDLKAIIYGSAPESRGGMPMTFLANVQPGVPFNDIAASGAQGIGLYRSEYLWITAEGEPSENAQFEAYSDAVRAITPLGGSARCVFRVFDLGGDKFSRDMASSETNPFLGNRSLRWLLSHRTVFLTQLRAILRASAHGSAAVLYPMVATVEELRSANEALNEAMGQLRAAGIPFDEKIQRGAMIEVPSAALNAATFAREVDFFSIGTNDLIQYTLAADRGNGSVAYLYQPTNPAVVRLVDHVASAAKNAGITVAVCGETASNPVLAFLWAALGVNELSMSAGFIPIVSRVFSSLSQSDARQLADEVRAMLDGSTAAEIYCHCRTFIRQRFPAFVEIETFLTRSET